MDREQHDRDINNHVYGPYGCEGGRTVPAHSRDRDIPVGFEGTTDEEDLEDVGDEPSDADGQYHPGGVEEGLRYKDAPVEEDV